MSRPRLLRPMAPDLTVLGDQIEAAVQRDLKRRRARRQSFLNAAASIAVAIPLAIAVGTADLSPVQYEVGAGGARASLAWTPGYDISLTHIPEKPLPKIEYAECLDGMDCRVVTEVHPVAIDFPPRRPAT